MSTIALDRKAMTPMTGRLLGKKIVLRQTPMTMPTSAALGGFAVREAFTRTGRHPGFEKMLVPKAAADTHIDRRAYLNFSSYNDLGLNGHPAVNKAAKLSNHLFERGINVQAIVHPAVEERLARLRFFLSSQHTARHIEHALASLEEDVR